MSDNGSPLRFDCRCELCQAFEHLSPKVLDVVRELDNEARSLFFALLAAQATVDAGAGTEIFERICNHAWNTIGDEDDDVTVSDKPAGGPPN